jgi:YesN/AraC family two-component response regulator
LVQKHSQKSYSLPVQKVITCIDTDITADLSLKTLAGILNVNSSYLSTLFKKETGITLTEYVNKKRVERAKLLLKNGNVQIQTVAQNCGILDVNYFTKIFKKHTGVTPREYREM